MDEIINTYKKQTPNMKNGKWILEFKICIDSVISF